MKVFSEHGIGAVVLSMEPSRYEHCKGNERSDDLRQVLEAGPGLLTRQAMLRTPFVWIQVKPPKSSSPRSSHHSSPSRWSQSRSSYQRDRRSLIDRIRERIQRSNRVAKLFRPRFSAECHRWLNEPLPAHRQRLVPNHTYF